jgi:hypothetical protein
MVHPKLLEKQEQAKYKTSRRGELTKTRDEIETKKKKIQKFKKIKIWLFEKNKQDQQAPGISH